VTKTRRYRGLVLGSFLAPEIDMICGDGVGASLVQHLGEDDEQRRGQSWFLEALSLLDG